MGSDEIDWRWLMTAEQFVARLAKRHKNADDGTLKDLDDIAMGQTLDTIEEMYVYYQHNWEAAYCPKPAFFYKWLERNGKAKQSSKVFYGAWVCADCGTRYAPLNVDQCPRCGGGDTSGVDDQAHPNFMWVNLPEDRGEVVEVDWWALITKKSEEVTHEQLDSDSVRSSETEHIRPVESVGPDPFF
jgi:hypothetical protein